MPGREEFWNVGYPLFGALVYLLLIITPVALGWAFYRRVRVWRLGGPNNDLGPWKARLRRTLKVAALDIFGHRRFVKRELYPGLMHFFLFWGFLWLLIATTIVGLEFNFHKYNPFGFDFPTARFRVQEDFIWDIFGGLFATIGVSMAIIRRYLMRPARLNTFVDDHVILWLLFSLVITGFVVEGLRIAGDPPEILWAAPIGYLFSIPFQNVSQSGIETIHLWIYWIHAVGTAVAFVYLAVYFSKISHIFISPLNAFLRPNRPNGALKSMGNLETLENFGAKDITDFSWKQLMDFDACTNCGRCQDQCPAYASGKPLSPRKVIQDLREFSTKRSTEILSNNKSAVVSDASDGVGMIDFVNPEAIWSCTTCMACMEACPVFIGHIDSIVDMRRNLVLERSEMPQNAMNALQSIEQRGHPWKGTGFTRTDWFDGLDIKTMEEDKDVEILFWVGCTSALDERSQSVARAMASVLKVSGVKFGILGNEETCTGDPARRMGNEYLFQMQAQQNIDTFKKYEVKKIVTICPHCFNTMKNEYPQLASDVEVVHYVQFVNDLIKDGRLKPVKKIDATVAYHDSCYLGRHNGVYEQPREIAKSIPGLEVIEIGDKSRERGFCCGAGGGRIWMDEQGQKVNHIRTEHFLDTDAPTVAVSCPFCLQMFNEGISSKGVQENKSAKDLLELLADSVDDN